jgi:stress-induced morphogen
MSDKKTINFKKAYQQLKNKSDMKFSIEIYHHDFSGEPLYNSESYVEKILLDYVDEHGLIITIMTSETTFSFSEKNWLVHVDEKYVSFGSSNDDDTYCIIEFC